MFIRLPGERVSLSEPVWLRADLFQLFKSHRFQRALRLVEAISRDVSQQLMKVLGTRRLMHIPFDDFERVMAACFDVFTCWDDE